MSYVFNRIGSGGESLNFRVIGGTTQPQSASDNTIWINTSTPIGTYYVSDYTPLGASAGDVWIKTKPTTSIDINVVKGSHGIYAHLDSVYQYAGGLWTAMTAYIYQNSSWVQIIHVEGCITYDFTKSLADSNTGMFPGTLYNTATRDSDGIHLVTKTSAFKWNYFDLDGMVVDITFGDCTPDVGTDTARLILFDDNVRGIVLYGGNKWNVYNGEWRDVIPSSMATNLSLFENATLRIVFRDDARYQDAYVNGDPLYSNMWIGYHGLITLGSTNLGFYSIDVKSMSIMTREYAGVTIT